MTICFKVFRLPKFTPILRDTLAFLRAFEIINSKRPTGANISQYYRLSSSGSLHRIEKLVQLGFIKRSVCGGHGLTVTREGAFTLREGNYR